MKFYIIFISIFCLIFTACRKDRTCNCSVTTSGISSTRNQTAAITIDFPPLPPVVITPETDTTYLNVISNSTTEVSDYTKVSKNTMYKNCPEKSERGFYDVSSTVNPGASTVTVVNSGKKIYSCKIE